MPSGTDAAFSTGPKDENAEALSPWMKRWSESKIGWHQKELNHILAKHGDKIIPEFSQQSGTDASCAAGTAGLRIFVPLCGKTVDMAYLAGLSNVDEVVGIDGISLALEEFAAENSDLVIAKVEGQAVGPVEKWHGSGITLLRGDFFELDDAASGGKYDRVWDRASLVAIQPDRREDYIGVMGKVIKPSGTILLVTLDRREGEEKARKAGPPFSVDEAEVRRLFENADWVDSVQLVEEFDEFEQDPASRERWEGQGLTKLFELCFVITAKEKTSL